ncbi:hypothetical protein [Neisseria mucosa]|uniref:Uncharacterized protein n=2 Tax=Neisseria TaxID=482 RepID=I2NPH3_NEISI|nr:hypothetical protein [Neisseria mucosa]EGQ78434.1 hypothetical protein HMPREF9418_0143 [Neisseria macacae ATCC 33926]EIG27734.1 hypothetical protein HMPREF1051_2906 [Neisseria sicca VK64]
MSDGSRQHSGRGRECQKGRLKYTISPYWGETGFSDDPFIKT